MTTSTQRLIERSQGAQEHLMGVCKSPQQANRIVKFNWSIQNMDWGLAEAKFTEFETEIQKEYIYYVTDGYNDDDVMEELENLLQIDLDTYMGDE